MMRSSRLHSHCVTAMVTISSAMALVQPALGQGAPYNRSIDAADIAFASSADGQSSDITVEIRFQNTLDVPCDLSLFVLVAVNGQVLPTGGSGGGGTGITQRIIVGAPSGPGPIPGSLDCVAFCQLYCFYTVNGTTVPGACDPFTFGTYCWCSVPADVNVPGSPCRLVLSGPQLAPGDIISVSLAAMTDAEPGGAGPVLPELDTTDDYASIVVPAPHCPADFDLNGTREVPDIFAFLSAWFALDIAADLDGNPGITVPDIFFFLSLWFAGC